MDETRIWQSVLGEVEVSVSRASYITWFKNTVLLSHSDEGTVIGVPNVFCKQQLEQKFNDLIEGILHKKGIDPRNLSYKIYAGKSTPSSSSRQKAYSPASSQARLEDNAVTNHSGNNLSSTNELSHNYRKGLNQKYTFETFVSGSGNELAYAACQAVADHVGTKYNPLFVYGGVGVGKTHLIQAVGNQILASKPNSRVVYVSSEQFVQELTEAIRFKKVGSFAQHYRNVDALIIDDVQFIAGKEKTQEEFFHTFNVLHQANKQIIISSDQPPQAIDNLEERLRSRFLMGMSVDMQNPDFETRCAIIQSKAESQGLDIENKAIEFLAESFQINVRELEGALNQLLAFCELRGVPATADVAKAVFAKIKARPKHTTPKQIVEKVAKYYDINYQDITGPRRDRDFVLPRQVAMYLLRDQLKMSFPRIATELGRKDHTTAIHSVSKISENVLIDVVLRQQVQELRDQINA